MQVSLSFGDDSYQVLKALGATDIGDSSPVESIVSTV